MVGVATHHGPVLVVEFLVGEIGSSRRPCLRRGAGQRAGDRLGRVSFHLCSRVGIVSFAASKKCCYLRSRYWVGKSLNEIYFFEGGFGSIAPTFLTGGRFQRGGGE